VNKKLLSYALLIILTVVSSQNLINASVSAPTIEWQQDYGHAGFYEDTGIQSASNLIQTSDGGYVFMDLGWAYQFTFVPSTIYKVNSSGSIEWSKTIELLAASTIIQTSDEGYEILGHWSTYGTTYENTPTIIKTDAEGTIQWVQNFSGYMREFVPNNDGGFIVLSDGRNPDLYPGTFTVLTKINPQGVIQWNHTYGELTNFSFGSSVIQTVDGGYALVGSTSFNGTNDSPNLYYWLFKTDSVGNLVWSRYYGNGPASLDENDTRNSGANEGLNRGTFGDNEGVSIIETADGDLIVAGIFYSESSLKYWDNRPSTFLFKTDSQGNMEWNQTFDDYEVSLVIPTSDNGFALAGSSGIIKTDSNGNTQWIKNVTYPTIDAYPTYTYPLKISSLIETSDGALATLGVGYRLTDNPRTGKIYLIKTEAFLPLPTQAPLPLPMSPSSVTPAPSAIFEVLIILLIIGIIAVASLLFFFKKRKH
jgi:hypothetical protein